jgi:hypothetical protein
MRHVAPPDRGPFASQPAGRSHLYYCDLCEIEIEIAIEIEKVWDLDFDPDFDFDKTICMRSHWPQPAFPLAIKDKQRYAGH